jgi:hypothetical protein
LANENLLFWREAIKFKMQFDRKSFEHSQESAKVLWRTFIAPQAALPINISGNIKRDIDIRFKGVVGRGIFDVALVEVYLMMQNGAFQRFIQTPKFKEYAQNRADFSMQHSVNLQVVPGGGPDDESGLSSFFSTSGDISEYIKVL